MTNFFKFLDDDHGAVTIDWVALTAGILLLGIMVVYAIFNGGVAGLVTDINATLTAVTTDIDTGSAPNLNGGGGPMLLAGGGSLPVGSEVLDSIPGLALIGLPDGSTTVISSAVGVAVPIGTTVSSATSLTLPNGSTVAAGDLGLGGIEGPV